jgi:hypothetical protein
MATSALAASGEIAPTVEAGTETTALSGPASAFGSAPAPPSKIHFQPPSAWRLQTVK